MRINSDETNLKKTANLESRFRKINSLITKIESEIDFLLSQNKTAPDGAWIVRYRAKGKGGTYWYYKWQSKSPIFVSKFGKKTRNKYIGKAGSPAFIEAVEMMKLRVKIEGLKQVHHTLELALFDLIDEATKSNNLLADNKS
jgi:hypothetical protein